MSHERKLIVYIACSLDGFIAAPGDDLSFLKTVERQGEDYGYATFMEKIDTVIMGRKTYDWVVKEVGDYPDKTKPVYVLSATNRPDKENVHFYHADPAVLVSDLRKQTGKHIFLDGGATAIGYFQEKQLIDEWIISIVPVLLGSGIRLFKDGNAMQSLACVSTKHFDSGLVQLHYTTIR